MGTKPFRMRCPGFWATQPMCGKKKSHAATQRCHATLPPDPGRALRVFDHLSHGTVGPGRSGEVSASRRCETTFFAELVELCFFLFSMYMIVYVYSVYCMHTYNNYIYIYTYIQSIYLSICLSVCLSIYLSVCLSVCLSIYLSIYILLYDICIM